MTTPEITSSTAAVVFIGDEVSAAGFRLAGVRVAVPLSGEEGATLSAARRDAGLVLITAEVAARLPPAVLTEVVAAGKPLLLVLPDVRGRLSPPDLKHEVRAQLGIES